jgi:cell division protein FtsB
MNMQGLKGRQILLIAGLAVLFYLIMDFNNRMAELHRLSAQSERVSAQATSLIATQAYLEEQIAYATSDSAVEEWAREEGRWMRPGDQPVVPLVPPGSTVVPTPTPVVTPERVQNWEVWLALFVDRDS